MVLNKKKATKFCNFVTTSNIDHNSESFTANSVLNMH